MPKMIASRSWCRRRISLSVVPVFISGKRALIRRNACSKSRIVTRVMRSRNVTRLFRSTTTSKIPFPDFPETMKSNSTSPTLFRALIWLGLSSMKARFVSEAIFGRPPLLRVRLRFRWVSILLPYTLVMKRYMPSLDMEGRVGFRRIDPAMASGDWSSINRSVISFRKATCSTIFIPWYFAYFLRTYALCSAFFGSYDPATRLRLISCEMVFGLRPVSSAIRRMPYPLMRYQAIS